MERDGNRMPIVLYVVVGIVALFSITYSTILFRADGYSVGRLVQQRVGARLEVVGVDTTYVISRQEHEYLLNQAKEQNSFLNTILTIVVTTFTFFAGGAGLFMWLIQKKYESMGEKYSALQSSLGNHENDVAASKQEIVRLRDESLERLEQAVGTLKPILEKISKDLDDTRISDMRKEAVRRVMDELLRRSGGQAGQEGEGKL